MNQFKYCRCCRDDFIYYGDQGCVGFGVRCRGVALLSPYAKLKPLGMCVDLLAVVGLCFVFPCFRQPTEVPTD